MPGNTKQLMAETPPSNLSLTLVLYSKELKRFRHRIRTGQQRELRALAAVEVVELVQTTCSQLHKL